MAGGSGYMEGGRGRDSFNERVRVTGKGKRGGKEKGERKPIVRAAGSKDGGR